MSEQFDGLQDGLAQAADSFERLSKPFLQASEAMVDSLDRLVHDQLALGRACFDVTSSQVQRLAEVENLSDLRAESGALESYRDALVAYGEAVRENGECTREALTGIGERAAAEWREVAQGAGK
ncbi:MAG: hypothetical protein L0H19_07345, partial [Salinisphaera sp.]|nr:hypothetical protein [Salinisphaera sp.]